MQKGKMAGAWKAAGAVGAGLGAACVLGSGLDVQAQTGRDTLQAYRNRNRVLLVFARGREDARYQRQFSLLKTQTAGLNERELTLIYALGDGKGQSIGTHIEGSGDAPDLRRRFAVTPGQFKVVLIGKDGHTAYTSDHPISSEQLFGLIDAMPMRRAEMRQRASKMGGKDAVEVSSSAPDSDAKTGAVSARNKSGKTASNKTPSNKTTLNKNLPNKNLTPAQVVRTQMEALQHNDTPHRDAGIETTFAFASPDNKQATGPLDHFIGIVKAPAYLPMLNCKSIAYDPIAIEGDTAKQRVHIVGADGTRGVYVFLLSRQTDGPFAGCWMNDGCIREEPEPTRDTSNDA